jgi:secernin
MCDTLYAAPSASGGGRAWFAKNSDRNPAEPQALCIAPRRPPSAELRVSGRLFAGPDRGHAYALSRPVWMEGGEMGVNERGVAIGNEAVFSRFKAKRSGVLGMDILRAALSRADSAAEARDFICACVEAADQGGNGAYKGSLVYSNSFIVAGPEAAFVVETAGRRWAWKTIDSIASISNAYSIGRDYEGLDRASRAEGPISWRDRVQDRLYLLFTKGDSRRACTGGILSAGVPDISLATMLAALRSHGLSSPGKLGMAAPCIHDAGFPVRSATTASLVFEYLPVGARSQGILWFTGRSYPCLSVFAPLLLAGGEFIPLWTGYDYTEGAAASASAWELGRARARRGGGASRSADGNFIARRDSIQERLESAAREAARSPSAPAGIAAARRAVDAAMSEWGSFLDGGSA